MKKNFKKILMAFLVMIIYMNVRVNAQEVNVTNPIIKNNKVTWDSIYFGSYYQTNENYKEPIKWRVLSVEGDDAFIISDKSLDCKSFADTEKGTSWEKSTIRKWLNIDFYNTAFDNEEQTCIKETDVINNDYYTFYQGDVYGMMRWGTNEGYYTKDKVYLLSIEEARNYKYGFSSGEMTESNESNPTDYAKNVSDKYGKGWMLRSLAPEMGSHSNDLEVMESTEVYYGIAISKDGEKIGAIAQPVPVYQDRVNYIRPALHINLNSSHWQYAGTVSAEWECGKHNFELVKKVDSTNEAEGEAIYKCSICGETKKEVIAKKLSDSTVAKNKNISNKLSKVKIKGIKKYKGTFVKIMFKKIQGANSYQVQYSNSKKFRKARIKKCKSSKCVLKKLAKGKVYYIRIRAISGTKKGQWSNVKKVKIKKSI